MKYFAGECEIRGPTGGQKPALPDRPQPQPVRPRVGQP